MNAVLEGLQRTFDDLDPAGLTAQTKLGDVPGWDSMNAVTLVMQLEKVTGKKLQGLRLSPDMTLADVAAKIG